MLACTARSFSAFASHGLAACTAMSSKSELATQEELVSLEDRLHMLRRMNSQLERSESDAQLRTANAQQQVSMPGI